MSEIYEYLSPKGGGSNYRQLFVNGQRSSFRHRHIRADNDPRRDMTDGDIARALDNFEAANTPIANEFRILNHWR